MYLPYFKKLISFLSFLKFCMNRIKIQGGGFDVYAGTAVGSVVTNKYRNHKEKKLKDFGTYTVEKDAEDKKAELKLTYGDRVTIYAIDGKSILITKNGDNEKAYFVSSDFLKDCTDYIEK